MMEEKYTIYDLETPANLFTAGFKDFKTKQRKNFVIHESRNDLIPLMKFIRSIYRHGYTLVGYNSLQFDAQIIEYLINNYYEIKHWSGEHIAEKISELANKIISLPDDEKFQQLIPEWRLNIPQIDLFKQLRYDARKIALKWLQFTMRFPNIESMPIHHTQRVGADSIPLVLSYMNNDVDSTLELFTRVKFETDLRIQLSQEYNLNLMNASEPRLAREIFGKFLCEKMDIQYRDLKEMRSFRPRVYGKDIIFKYIKFNDPILKGIHDFFYKLSVNPINTEDNNYELKDVMKSFKYHNIEGDVGLGGIHGCVNPGIYEESKNWKIEDIDGTSYYPKIGIENNLFPEHLSKYFPIVYNSLFEMRQKIEKKSPINYIFKIILNAAYGLSKEPNNYFYDPKYTYAITINGQLMLLKLAEMMKENVPGVIFYQFNTDGITIGYDPKYTDKVDEVKKRWTKVTKIGLENNFYKKMVIMDVNNYLAVDHKGKVKRKGLFGYSLDPEDKEMYYHKNPSALIIPKALEAYFVHGIPYEDFIKESEDIFDFCFGVKITKDFNLVKHSYNKETQQIDKEIIKQQVVRYYISNEACSLKKKYKEGSKMALKNSGTLKKTRNYNIQKESNIVEVQKGYNMTYYNVHVEKPISEYGLNYNYYISAVRDIIGEIQPNVLNLKLF